MTFRWDGFGSGFGWFFLVNAALSIAFVVVMVVLIVQTIRWPTRNSGAGGGAGAPRPGEDAALAVLRERFARGEIDASEFEERKRTLGG